MIGGGYVRVEQPQAVPPAQLQNALSEWDRKRFVEQLWPEAVKRAEKSRAAALEKAQDAATKLMQVLAAIDDDTSTLQREDADVVAGLFKAAGAAASIAVREEVNLRRARNDAGADGLILPPRKRPRQRSGPPAA